MLIPHLKSEMRGTLVETGVTRLRMQGDSHFLDWISSGSPFGYSVILDPTQARVGLSGAPGNESRAALDKDEGMLIPHLKSEMRSTLVETGATRLRMQGD